MHFFPRKTRQASGHPPKKGRGAGAAGRVGGCGGAGAARLLGVPERAALQSARSYYQNIYLRRAEAITHYFTTECAPGKSLDERLADAPW